MNFRRRGVLLAEMLTVILMVGVGGTLIAVAFASMLKSQERVARLSNRFATTNDFVSCIRDDIRAGTTLRIRTSNGTDGNPHQVLTVVAPSGSVSYRFFKEHVERDAGPSGQSAKSWAPLVAATRAVDEANATKGPGVYVVVRWLRDGHNDLEPNRRFDLFVRCAGEESHAED